jgi:hypothetical protein
MLLYIHDNSKNSTRIIKILEIESNNRYRKYKESAHMACLTNPTGQPSLDISPIWILLSIELPTHREEQYDVTYFFLSFYNSLVPNVQFLLHR